MRQSRSAYIPPMSAKEITVTVVNLFGAVGFAINAAAASLDPTADQMSDPQSDQAILVSASSVASAPGVVVVQNAMTGDAVEAPPQESVRYFVSHLLTPPSS